VSDFMMFLRRFVANPGRIGSIVPSSPHLCRQMMSHIPWPKLRTIVELGPGTGVFTRHILENKPQDALFFAIERDPQFREILRERFPRLLIKEEALKLGEYLQEMDVPQVDVVVSGLPFANFSPELRSSILREVYQSLAPGGRFVTFQYSLQLKQELIQMYKKVDVSFTPLNIPPAFVYTCIKD
jgi:phospholipid N-methyltransferase